MTAAIRLATALALSVGLTSAIGVGPATLPASQAIKCDASSPGVFRLVNANVHRLYPNPTVASSWDPNWGSFVVANCSALTRGDDLKLNPASLPVGQAIKCDASSAKVYRIMNNFVYRGYPSPTIATSWEANWSSSIVVADCSVLTPGEALKLNPASLPVGQAIKCDASSPGVFRLVNANVHRLYPNPTIASSWDPNWGSFVVAECSGLTRGEDMAMKTQ